MKQTGIVDRFEGDRVIVELKRGFIDVPRQGTPPMLAEGMVVQIEDGVITEIDLIETQRREDDLRRRFERLLGKKNEFE